MKNVFVTLCLFCAVSVTKAQSLNLLWSTDSSMRVPESVFHDEKQEKFMFQISKVKVLGIKMEEDQSLSLQLQERY